MIEFAATLDDSLIPSRMQAQYHSDWLHQDELSYEIETKSVNDWSPEAKW